MSAPPNPIWKPPKLSEAYEHFRDSGRDISSDAKKFFGLGPAHFKVLPKIAAGKCSYWLSHVWDFVKVHQSRVIADRGLGDMQRKHEDRMDDAFASYGLVVDIADDEARLEDEVPDDPQESVMEVWSRGFRPLKRRKTGRW